jgi:phosphoribosylformimino-5-aminoimidazole carboxamide ribotide isomerase
MIIVPAIDLHDGKVVRLKQGRLQDETVYGQDPVEVAQSWAAQGAQRIHLVDLSAAIEGKPQPDLIEKIARAVTTIALEIGGGLRTLEMAMRYKQMGIDRVIFGTAALARPGVVQEAARLWPESVAVAVDVKDGKVAVAGWNETSTVDALALVAQVKAWGVPRVQYTDVLRDGTLVGPNVAGIERIARDSGLKVTAGGGISVKDDLAKMKPLAALGVDEIIVGKALYEKRFTLAEAIAAIA